MEYKLFKEKKSKESALRFFPEFFEKDLELNGHGLEYLKTQYINYCIEYFEKYCSVSNNERIMIKDAYDYLERVIKEQKGFAVVTTISQYTLENYENLIKEISNYGFNPQKNGSYGYNQNITNRQILLELSFLKPILTKTLKKVDKYIESVEDQEINEFYIELVERLEGFSKRLITSRIELKQARENYYESWIDNNRGFLSETSFWLLGENKNAWRKNRNNSCCTIIEVIKEIQDINLALFYHSFNYINAVDITDEATDEITKLYDFYMSGIRKSPNYFCYIDNAKKEELSHQKVLRKEQSKKISKF